MPEGWLRSTIWVGRWMTLKKAQESRLGRLSLHQMAHVNYLPVPRPFPELRPCHVRDDYNPSSVSKMLRCVRAMYGSALGGPSKQARRSPEKQVCPPRRRDPLGAHPENR
jgi:hypothetical protein